MRGQCHIHKVQDAHTQGQATDRTWRMLQTCFGEPCLGFYSLTVASGTYLDTDPQCSCMCTWLSEGPHVRLGNWCHLPRKATLRLEAPGSEGPRVLLKPSICAPQSPSSQPKHELQSQVPPFLVWKGWCASQLSSTVMEQPR